MRILLPRRTKTVVLCWSVALLIGLVFAESVVAQNRPTAVPTGRSGYKLELTSTNWPSNEKGLYCLPFKLTRDPLSPAPLDEVFTITVETSQNYLRIGEVSFSKQVTIPLGSNSVSGELPIQLELMSATYNIGTNIGTSIRVERGPGDGEFSRNDLILDQLFIPSASTFAGTKASLYLTSNAKKAAPSATLFFWDGMMHRQFNQNQAMQRAAMWAPTSANSSNLLGGTFVTEEWVEVDLQSLPDSWEGMEMIEEALIGFSDLQTLCKNETSRNVLESWVASGGHLIVAGQANDLNHTKDILSVLCGSERVSGRANGRWKHFFKNAFVQRKFSEEKDVDRQNHTVVDVTKADQLEDVNMLVQGYAAGVIVSVENLGDKKADQASYKRLQLILASQNAPSVPAIRNPQWRPPMSPIPGVGNPPFGLFVGFLFGFLFLIGPALIYYIRRTKARTQYLFFVVPVVSLFTCISILGYSYFVDFAKQSARIRSVTVMQPETGMAYNQSMMAYYCGDQPGGYEYDEGTIAFTELSNTDVFHHVTGEDGSKRITSSQIAPRKLHFVFAHTAHQTDQRLIVGNENGGAPQVENRLDVKIKLLLFRVNDTIYMLENLEDGKVGVGQPVDFKLLQDKLENVFPIFQPQASVFRRAYPGFFESGYVGSFRQKVQSGFQVNKLTNVLPTDRDFIAFTDEDPMSVPLREPFDYRLRNHIIYGKH